MIAWKTVSADKEVPLNEVVRRILDEQPGTDRLLLVVDGGLMVTVLFSALALAILALI